MHKLALLGGEPVRRHLFPEHNTIGPEEKQAAIEVLDSGNLSQFLGSWSDDFYGGRRSKSSSGYGLHTPRRSLLVRSTPIPRDSWLRSALATSVRRRSNRFTLHHDSERDRAVAYGAVPVFADIDRRTFCLDPASIEERITPRTKAILVVHLFGHPADMDAINALARRHGLRVIEDCAQGPETYYHGKMIGGLGDLGVFSLNYHKHIHTGEGGVVTTDNDVLTEKVSLIRNHGEYVVADKGTTNLVNTYGFNYRLTELQAAIGIEQLKKLPGLMEIRRQNSKFLDDRLGQLKGLTPPFVEEGCTHSYYMQPYRYDAEIVGIPRDTFLKALRAELPSSYRRENDALIGGGYAVPLYFEPIYQKRIGKCAFNCPRYEGKVSYERGLCPVTEQMHFSELFTLQYNRPGMSQSDLQDVVDGFEKVYAHREELRDWHE